MKIGVNSRIYQNENTGIPYYIECLYKKLLKIDKSNRYIFFQIQRNKTIGKTKTINLPNNNLSTFLFDNFLINNLIDNEKIDIFHGPAHILPFFKNKNIKYLLTVHDLSFLTLKNNQFLLFNLYYRYVIPRALKNADIIIADSRNTKEDIRRFYHIADNKIKVIYLGVNDIYFSLKKTKRLITDRYFLSLTTHPKRKNILRILEILARNKNLSDYKYVIAGLIKGEQLSSLKKKVKELNLENRVVVFGYATEEGLKNLYQNAEFFIYPSFYEGFGLPILEAIACKCPVIASNTSSIPEIYPDKNWLINPYNQDDISNKIDKMITLSKSERNCLIEKNYNFSKRFTWEETAQNYLRLINSLI